jgi:hypothetical protein
MMHRRASEAIDWTLRDLMQLDDTQVTEKIFGGKTVVLGGDFQQIMHVVPKGGRKDIVSVLLPQLHLWQRVTILRFHINMQVMVANFEEQRKFAKWVLNVGDGSLPTIVEEEGVDPDWIKIPSHMRLPIEDCSLRGLIQTIYSDHQRHSRDAMYFMQYNIMAPKNIDIDEVNNVILESLFEELHMYLNVDSFASIKGASAAAGVSMDSLYPVEFLNTLQLNGITNHKLELKVGVLILLLRNLNQSIGLCNGTRLIVKRLGQRVIKAKIITRNNVSKCVFIPCIIMSPSETDSPFVLRCRQFLVQVAFAMTINKSQG